MTWLLRLSLSSPLCESHRSLLGVGHRKDGARVVIHRGGLLRNMHYLAGNIGTAQLGDRKQGCVSDSEARPRRDPAGARYCKLQ
jgi:hypothetical protein